MGFRWGGVFKSFRQVFKASGKAVFNVMQGVTRGIVDVAKVVRKKRPGVSAPPGTPGRVKIPKRNVDGTFKRKKTV